jgi:hypothetical protein
LKCVLATRGAAEKGDQNTIFLLFMVIIFGHKLRKIDTAKRDAMARRRTTTRRRN